jgi:hypothetical protein
MTMAVDDVFEQVARQQDAQTARLIGATDEARLRWLLKFAATENCDEMSSSKFERLRRQIQEFASIRWSSYETADNPVSRDAAQQLALKVSDGIGAYARERSWDLPRMSIARSVIPNSDRPLYNGRWNDTFLMSAADLLQTVGKLLRVCAAEGCEVFFVKRKRRIFCSERCSGGERMRRFQKDSSRYKAKRRKYYLKSRRTRAGAQNA